MLREVVKRKLLMRFEAPSGQKLYSRAGQKRSEIRNFLSLEEGRHREKPGMDCQVRTHKYFTSQGLGAIDN